MLPEYNPRTGHPIGCTCSPCRSWFEFTMAGPHMDFIGQRADKAVVKDARLSEEHGGVEKEIEYYTMTCPDCDGDGYYDKKGEVVCDDCGVVISGDVKPLTYGEPGHSDQSAGHSAGTEPLGNYRGINGVGL